MLRRKIVGLLLAVVLFSALGVGSAAICSVHRELTADAEWRISDIHRQLNERFAMFDRMIAENEAVLDQEIEANLPRIAEELADWAERLEAIPTDVLEALSDQYGVQNIYLIDRVGVVVNTDFLPDRGLNLRTLGGDMLRLLDSLYGQGRVKVDRVSFSTLTGGIRKYAYYSPKGSDYVIEVSVDLLPYLRATRSDQYVDFLFKGLFALESLDSNIVDIDIQMANELRAVSLLHAEQAPDLDRVRTVARSDTGLRRIQGNRIEVYERIRRQNTAISSAPYMISKVVYDTTRHRALLGKITIIVAAVSVLFALIAFGFATVLVNRDLLRPIRAMLLRIRAMADGVYEPLKKYHDDEIGHIADAFNLMQTRIAVREEELREINEELEEKVRERTHELEALNQELHGMATVDFLTGLYNRREFQRIFEIEWAHHRRNAKPLGFVIFDLDHFKLFNDTYGHAAGDDCLQQVARAVSKSLRRPGDLAARYGGEEFVVVLPETDGHGAATIAEKMRQAIAELGIRHEQTSGGSVTASFGVASIVPDQDTSPEQLMNLADQALYKSKEQGRNRVYGQASKARQ